MATQAGPIVFVVVGDDAVRDALTVALETAGHRVVAFASLAQFLDGCRDGQPGCLLVDQDLAGVIESSPTGMLITPAIALPTVLMSRALRPPRRCAQGVVRVLEQPFDDEALLGAIAQALSRVDHA